MIEDVVVERGVEILRDDQTASVDAEGPQGLLAQRHETGRRYAPTGDEDLLPGGHIIQQAREVSLGLMDTYGLSHGLSLSSLELGIIGRKPLAGRMTDCRMPLNAIEGTGSVGGLAAEGPEPQAVLGTLTTSAAFLVVSVRDTEGGDERVLDIVSDVGSLVRAVGFRQSEANLTCVVGFGSQYWDRFRPPGAPRPARLHPFRGVRGSPHDAPATPGDVLFHIRANRRDLVFELTRQLVKALGTDVQVEDHTVGFRYFDSRDLLGFVDGTENPTGRAAIEAAIIDAGSEPDFAGGSYVIVQKYVHDLDAWGALSTEEQEHVIGRTKLDDIELADDIQPSNSHVTLNTIVDEHGVEHDIVRDNMAFGDPGAGEYGTYYIAYAADPAITLLMLERMFVGAPAGNYDHILDVSTAVTGTLFFVPSLDLLESLADDRGRLDRHRRRRPRFQQTPGRRPRDRQPQESTATSFDHQTVMAWSQPSPAQRRGRRGKPQRGSHIPSNRKCARFSSARTRASLRIRPRGQTHSVCSHQKVHQREGPWSR